MKPINHTHLALVILACLAGSACSVIESRPATIQLTDHDLRDAQGRYRPPVHRVTREPANTMQTIYRTASGAEMDGPVYTINSH